MKKLLLIILCLLVIPLVVSAASTTETRKFIWEYDADALPYVSGWGLYMRPVSGGAAEQSIGITKGQTLTTSQAFTVSGTPGQIVRKFFVMDAVGLDGQRSDGYSNEVFSDFKIPLSAPFNLIVEVIIVPKHRRNDTSR